MVVSANYCVKKLKAVSIMSFHTVVVAKMESKSLGKDFGGYTNKSKRKKMFEKLIHEQALDVSEKQTR